MLEKRYHPQEQEARWQQTWAEQETYRFRSDPAKPAFSIDTPPPTVSGSLHIGHIFSYTQAEMVARHRRMTGHAVYYPFGYDDNGLPTERLIERESMQDTRSMSREDILSLGMPIVAKHEAAFQDLWQRLGFSCDWDLAYRTMSPQVQALSQAAFLDLARRNLAYPAEQPTLWCPHCRTSIAQADLDTKEADTLFHTIRFQLGDSSGESVASGASAVSGVSGASPTRCARAHATYLPVATTRPEMLYGCVALFIHPAHPVLAGYIGRTAIVPLYGHPVPILANPDADPEKGTGIVMCCTFGDAADVQWYRTYSLPYRKVLEPDGTLSAEIPQLAGLPVKRARNHILALLREAGILVNSEPLTHQVGIHERCGTETELLPSRQWYIRLLENKQRFVDAADEIHWHPAAMKNRYLDWVNGLKWDWCVSRQRRFGIPIPVWYCEDCGNPSLPQDSQLPVNPAQADPSAPCFHCGGTRFVPETGVLDTWATSSITPRINTHRRTELAKENNQTDMPAFLPMTMRTQAHEIIRTWAFYTIVRSLYADNTLPWRDIMICGYVMADKGEKISKSKNNASVEPLALLGAHSADALRYWAAGAKLGTDTTFRIEELDISRRFMTKLWNAARFSSIHLDTLTEADWSIAALQPADLWIIARFNEMLAEAGKAFDAYESGDARKILDAFFWHDFCDDWLELVKDRLYNPDTHGAAATAGAKVTLHRVLEGILKAYAPFVPHLVETIWQEMYHGNHLDSREAGCILVTEPAKSSTDAAFRSIHDESWTLIPLPEKAPDTPTLLALGEILQTAISEARRQKTQLGLSQKDSIEELRIFMPTGAESSLARPGSIVGLIHSSFPDLRGCTGAREILLE